MPVINEEIDIEFQELFGQIYIETTLDEYINFDAETATSEPAVDPTQRDWQQEYQEESILLLYYYYYYHITIIIIIIIILSSLFLFLLLLIFCWPNK